MKKRLLSAVLAGSMMLTMLPATAFAEMGPDKNKLIRRNPVHRVARKQHWNMCSKQPMCQANTTKTATK